MEKKKIDFAKYGEMYNESEISGQDQTKVNVRNHIPYADKYRMAQELAEQILMIHNDSCTYDSYKEGPLWKLKILEYYTDIDTSEITPEQAADFMINNNLLQQIQDIIGNDLDEVKDIYYRMRDSVMTTYDDDHSLKTAFKTSFGFLFNGEDITESLAKAETAGGTLFDALAALKAEEKKKSPGVVNVGGNILNFAKKE